MYGSKVGKMDLRATVEIARALVGIVITASVAMLIGCGTEEPVDREPLTNNMCLGVAACSAMTAGVGAGAAGTVAPFAGAAGVGSGGIAGGVAGTVAAGVGGAAGTIPTGTGGVAGVVATGGVGGMVTGGAGGVAGTVATGGVGGAMTGGAAGAAGGEPMMSTGCGAADHPASGTFNIDVDGLSREYIVKIPADYDPSTPYKLIFTWHYLGGSASGIAGGFGGGYYGLESRSQGSAIFVSPEGIDAAWPNTGGRDVAFARAMVEWLNSNYCIDQTRVFSTGFSYGAIMSNTVGCAMGDVFRAIAPMSGSGPRAFGGAGCMGPVAAWISHGNTDRTVSFASGQGSRDHWVTTNGCETASAPTTPSPCVTYNGCDDGFPVTWCEYSGGHTQPSFAPDAIWDFFAQF